MYGTAIKSQVKALKEVDPIYSLKMWDWYVEVNTMQELSLKLKNWKLTLGWLIMNKLLWI